MLFANDTLILCDASKENFKYLSWTSMWFEAISRLKINLEKSELIPIGDVSNLEELVGVLGCKMGTLPITYLGLPLGAPHKSYRVWKEWKNAFRKGLLCGKIISFKGGKIRLY